MPYDIASGLALDARVVQGSTSRTPVRASSAGGSAVPAGGNESPRVAPERPTPPPPPDFQRTIEALNRFLRETARSLQFSYDESAGRTVITVVDPGTGQVVRQIPSDELLRIARLMDGITPPRLFDGQA